MRSTSISRLTRRRPDRARIHFINRPDELPTDATVENSIVLMEHGNRGYIDVTAQTFGLAAWEALPQA